MAYTGSQAQSGRGSSLSVGVPSISITGSTTSASTTVTAVSDTTGITVGLPISGTGIPAGATVAGVGTTTLTLSAAATATGTSVALTVGGLTEVGEVRDFPLKRGPWVFVDTTNFQSSVDKETLPTIRDNGNFTFTGNRVSGDAGQSLIEAAYQNGTKTPLTITLPKTPAQTVKGDSYSLTVYVKSFDFTANPEKEIDFSIDVMTTGPTTFTAGS